MNLNRILVSRCRAFRFIDQLYQPSTSYHLSCTQRLHIKYLPRMQDVRYYSSDEKEDDTSHNSIQTKSRAVLGKRSSTLGGVVGKYKIFQDSDSPVILDVDEERKLRFEQPELFNEIQPQADPFEGMNLERGESGVFEIEELVQILRDENTKDLIVIAVPAEYQYVDYILIVTGRSQKHAYAVAEFIKKLFKKKMHKGDNVPIIEGGKQNDWLAMDLGNIALHIFTRQERERVDIETLWSVGAEYDDLANQKDEGYIQLLKQHTHPSLSGIQPADSTRPNQDQLG